MRRQVAALEPRYNRVTTALQPRYNVAHKAGVRALPRFFPPPPPSAVYISHSPVGARRISRPSLSPDRSVLRLPLGIISLTHEKKPAVE